MNPFTPHDLRRTAATLAGDLGFDDAWIAKCLDHAASKKQEQIVPSVTGKVYNHSKRMKEKRAVLDGVAAELRRIIGEPAPKVIEQDQVRLAAKSTEIETIDFGQPRPAHHWPGLVP